MSGILQQVNQFSAAAIAAVLNSLWQAGVVVAIAWLTMRFTTRMNAATRYLLWWAVLGVILVLPIAPGIIARRPALSIPAGPEQATVLPAVTLAVVEDTRTSVPLLPAPATSAAALELRAGLWPTWIVALWSVVLLLQLGRIAWSYRYLRQVKRRAHPASPDLRRNFDAWMMSCRVHRPTHLLVSAEIVSPMAVGFRQAAVILPASLLEQFQEPELDHVLLHELAHIARRDDWSNLVARVASAVLVLHPAATWVLRRIEREREIACDDWVVSMTGAAKPYAASLARLFELCLVRRQMLLASGMAGRASHLGERIEMLLHRSREFAPKASAARVALSTIALLALAVAGAEAPRWLAFAQEPVPPAFAPDPAPPAPSVPPAAPSARPAPQPPLPAATPTPQAFPSAPMIPPPDELSAAASTPPQPVSAAPPQRPVPPAELSAAASTPPQPASAAPPQRPVPPAKLSAAASTPPQPAGAAPPQRPVLPANPSTNGSFLAALVAAGYGNLSVDEIINLKNAGVSAAYLTGISQAGWGKLSSQEIVELSQRGVNPEYVRKIKDAGIRDVTLKDVMDMANSGVRAETIQEIHALGFGPYTARQAIQFSQYGARPELFRALKDAGLGNAAPNEIVEAHSVGLNAHDMREARQYGSTLTLKQIIKLKMAGVI